MDQKTELEQAVTAFMTYEDYLDSMLTKDDLMFLEDKDMCRELLVLGFHSNRRIIPKEVFERKKAEKEAKTNESKTKELRICSQGIECSDKLMQALASREEDNVTGCIATIIFLRDVNEKGEEISSYIDFNHRLKTEDWQPYFKGEKKLVPLETDLSFYNWTKETSFHAPSPNFDVIAETDTLKLLFVCKSDGYAVDVNLKVNVLNLVLNIAAYYDFVRNLAVADDDRFCTFMASCFNSEMCLSNCSISSEYSKLADVGIYRLDLNDSGYGQVVLFDRILDRPIP